jgi:hypothetical protein
MYLARQEGVQTMIPKSLHTVTALANLGRHIALEQRFPGNCELEAAVSIAAAILGYSDADDVYGLKVKATAILRGEQYAAYRDAVVASEVRP